MRKNNKQLLLLITILFSIVAVLFPYGTLANSVDIRDTITNPDFLNPDGTGQPPSSLPNSDQEGNSSTPPHQPVVGGQQPSTGLLNGEKYQQYIQDEKNKPSYGERFSAGILISFANWIFEAIGMMDPITLVFGLAADSDQGNNLSNIREHQVLGLFPEALFDSISYLYGIIENLLPIPLVLSLAIVGVIIMTQSGTQEGRSKMKDYTMAFIIAIVSLRFGYYLWIWVLDLNYFFIDLVWAALQDKGIKTGLFLDMLWGNGGYGNFVSFQGIGNAILVVLAAISVGVLNYQYAMRMIILSISILTFPVATTLSIFPKFRHSLQIWWQEFIGNVFIQSAHGFAYGLFFLILSSSQGGDLSFWVVVAYFFGMPTIVIYFRQLMGMQQGSGVLGAAGAMMGVAALMNMGRMFMGNKGGGGQRGNQSVHDLGSSQIEASGTNPTTPLLENLQGGKRLLNNKWVKGTAMATGATAGALISTMATGNPIMGAMVGVGASQTLGGAAGRLGQSISKAKEFASDVWDGMNPTVQVTNSQDGYYQPQIGATKSIGDVLESRYMSGQGGAIGNTAVQLGWGAQRLAHMVSGGRVGGSAVAKRDYIQGQQQSYQQAVEGMRQVQPELNLAKEQLTQAKATYGPGSQWYLQNTTTNDHGRTVPPPKHENIIQAEQQVNQLQGRYSHYKSQAMEANMNLSNHQRMREAIQPLQQQSSFSEMRGRL